MQRTGRKGHAQFRVIVQDARLTPTSGRVVARLGNYDPHTKKAALDKEKVAFYLEHGARPSDRVVGVLTNEDVKLPAWVKAAAPKKRNIKNQEKLRKNRPAEPEASDEKPAEAAEESIKEEAPAENTEEKPAEEKQEPNQADAKETENKEQKPASEEKSDSK